MKYSALYLLMTFAAVVSFTSCSDELNLPDGTWTAHAAKPIDPLPSVEYDVNGVRFKMIAVESGTFEMGPKGARHTVTLTKDYYIGETEVTQALWQAVTGHVPITWNETLGYGSSNPAYYISWDDAQDFISKLNQLTGQCFRLPTEAEWEFAARGGNKSKNYIYSGSDSMDVVGWYEENADRLDYGSRNYGSQAAKSKLPNELGIYDMSGNVYEWCSDLYGTIDTTPATDPQGPISSSDTNHRVIRGGSWLSKPVVCEVSYRGSCAPEKRESTNGLRLSFSR